MFRISIEAIRCSQFSRNLYLVTSLRSSTHKRNEEWLSTSVISEVWIGSASEATMKKRKDLRLSKRSKVVKLRP